MGSDVHDLNAARIDRDLMMGLRDNQVETALTRAQAAEQIRALQLVGQRMRELEGTPVWAQFQARLKAYKEDLLKALYASHDATTLAKKAGALECLALFENWAADEASAAASNIEQIKAELNMDSSG